MCERAIVYFQEQSCRDDITTEALHYYCRAVRALEKQVPKMVNHEKTFWTYKHFCPECSEQFKIENFKYCPHCGQRLDWSNYWEALK
jgi:hypothetical protein